MAHILIVDDTESEAILMGQVLSKMGHTFSVLSEGERCREVAESTHPALILLDVVMPGVDGFKICRQLMRDPATLNIPVIIVSSKDGETDRFWAEKQGARSYIRKPFTAEGLAFVVRKHLAPTPAD